MSLATAKSLPSSPRLTFTPEAMAVIKEGAQSISPSWDTTHISDPECSADSMNIGARAGGCTLFDVPDTYAIYPIEGGRFEVADMRDDFATIGAFATVEEAVGSMEAHAAAIRY